MSVDRSAAPSTTAMRKGRHRPEVSALLVVMMCLAGGQARAETFECDGLRRLSDNFLLDLQVRLVFDGARRRYTRFENTGRGWQSIAGMSTYRVAGDKIVLDPNPFVVSYIDRLSGTYYYIDKTGTTLSIWGHCGVTGPVRPAL